MSDQKICGLDAQGIEALKEKEGFLILATVKQGGETYQAIFREPDFKILESTRKITASNELAGAKALYNNCMVLADKEFEDREYLRLKATENIGLHMESFSTEVKNL